MHITIEEAYNEAVTALGEAQVRERLLMRRVAQLEATIAADQPSPETDTDK